MLKERYGDPYRIVAEYKKQLRQWPRIKRNDIDGYKKFQLFLLNFKSTMRYSQSNDYDNAELIELLQSKLLQHLQDGWNPSFPKDQKKVTTLS